MCSSPIGTDTSNLQMLYLGSNSSTYFCSNINNWSIGHSSNIVNSKLSIPYLFTALCNKIDLFLFLFNKEKWSFCLLFKSLLEPI